MLLLFWDFDLWSNETNDVFSANVFLFSKYTSRSLYCISIRLLLIVSSFSGGIFRTCTARFHWTAYFCCELILRGEGSDDLRFWFYSKMHCIVIGFRVDSNVASGWYITFWSYNYTLWPKVTERFAFRLDGWGSLYLSGSI